MAKIILSDRLFYFSNKSTSNKEKWRSAVFVLYQDGFLLKNNSKLCLKMDNFSSEFVRHYSKKRRGITNYYIFVPYYPSESTLVDSLSPAFSFLRLKSFSKSKYENWLNVLTHQDYDSFTVDSSSYKRPNFMRRVINKTLRKPSWTKVGKSCPKHFQAADQNAPKQSQSRNSEDITIIIDHDDDIDEWAMRHCLHNEERALHACYDDDDHADMISNESGQLLLPTSNKKDMQSFEGHSSGSLDSGVDDC